MKSLYKYEVKKVCSKKVLIGRRQYADIRYKVGEILYLNPEDNDTRGLVNRGYIERVEKAANTNQTKVGEGDAKQLHIIYQ